MAIAFLFVDIPTLVFFPARMRLLTARFLWRHIKYAVLVIFIVAAVLTPCADPWNQALFAAPMIGLYVISIGVAWLVASRDLKLVFVAAVVNTARRRNTMPAQFPRLWRGGPER